MKTLSFEVLQSDESVTISCIKENESVVEIVQKPYTLREIQNQNQSKSTRVLVA